MNTVPKITLRSIMTLVVTLLLVGIGLYLYHPTCKATGNLAYPEFWEFTRGVMIYGDKGLTTEDMLAVEEIANRLEIHPYRVIYTIAWGSRGGDGDHGYYEGSAELSDHERQRLWRIDRINEFFCWQHPLTLHKLTHHGETVSGFYARIHAPWAWQYDDQLILNLRAIADKYPRG